MKLRTLDLNLLVLLRALLEERHVSRAARRVGLSQPAMSNALDRCRQLFEDPLLERVGSTMRLTPRGEALRSPLAEILGQVELLVDVAEPALDQVRQTVRIVAADALTAVLVQPLQSAAADRAPGITLAFRAWTSGAEALSLLAKGAVDLAVSAFASTDPHQFVSEVVREETYVLTMRADHPLASQRTVDHWLDYPHIIVSAQAAIRTPIDDQLAALALARRVGVTVPSFILVPALLRGSDMIALAPGLSVAGERGAGLLVLSPPMPLAGFQLSMARRRGNEADVAVKFVADEVRHLLKHA